MTTAPAVRHEPVWQPIEERIYGHFFFYCRSLRIKPMRFERWLRISAGHDFYGEE
jgi:hypothetical protein